MKTMKCDCGYMIKGVTEKEVMDKMWKHIKKDHPNQNERIVKMPKVEQEKIIDESEK